MANTLNAAHRPVFEDQYVDVLGIRTRFWRAGERGSPVLLMHGLNGCVEHWRGTLDALSQAHRVWAFDAPGHGLSAADERMYDPGFMRDLSAEFMRTQGVERINLVALSGGGVAALKLALDCPQLLDRLVLVDAAGLGRGVSLRMRLFSMTPMPPASAFERSYSREQLRTLATFAFFANPAALTEDLLDDLHVNVRRPTAMWTASRMMRWGIRLWGQRYVYARRLREIQAPTLIIWGKQDRLLPVTHAHIAARRIPNARELIFDPCGHLPMLECPRPFNDAVRQFFAGR